MKYQLNKQLILEAGITNNQKVFRAGTVGAGMGALLSTPAAIYAAANGNEELLGMIPAAAAGGAAFTAGRQTAMNQK